MLVNQSHSNFPENFRERLSQLLADVDVFRDQFNSLLADVEVRERKIQILESAIKALSEATVLGSYVDLKQALRPQLIKALELCDMVDSGSGLIQLIENLEGKRELVVYSYYVHDETKLDLQRLALGLEDDIDFLRGITAIVATTGNPILIEDVRIDPRGSQFVSIIPDTRSSLTVPIKVGGISIGVLNLEHPDPKAFNKEHLYWVDLLAHLISQTVNKMWQYRQLEGTRNLVAAISRPREFDEIISLINEAITQITGAETIIILTREQASDLLLLENDHEIRVGGKQVRDRLQVKIGEGVTGRAVVSQSGFVYVGDVSTIGEIKEGRIVDQDGKVLYIQYLEDTRSNLGISLRKGEEAIGALNLESPRPNAFDSLSPDVIEIIAAGVSTALQLTENIRSINEYSEELLEAQRIFQDQHTAERINTLHEITGRVMIGDIMRLEEVFPQIKENAPAMMIIHRLAKTAHDLSHETSKFIKITRAEAGLGTNLDESLERVLQAVPLEGIELHRGYDPVVGSMAVTGQLDLILRNLMNNVVKYVEHGNLWINASIDDTCVHFEISDDGPGIPKEKHKIVLKHGGIGGTEKDGMGIGLSLANWCVKVANEGESQIQIMSDLGQGATFRFNLPRLNKGPNGDADTLIEE